MVGVISTVEEFESLVENSKGYVIVDYFAEWCGPCKIFAPTFTRMADQWKNVSFYKVDVDELNDKAEQHNITCMPTFVLYLDGKEVDRTSGANEMRVIALLNRSVSDD